MKVIHFAPNGSPVCSGSTPMRMKKTADAHAVTCKKCCAFIEKTSSPEHQAMMARAFAQIGKA